MLASTKYTIFRYGSDQTISIEILRINSRKTKSEVKRRTKKKEKKEMIRYRIFDENERKIE